MNATTKQRKAFGELLAACREARGLTSSRLAELLDMSRGTVSAYERGGREPDRGDVFRLEVVLECKPGTLSRTLGYLPVTTGVDTAPDTESAIMADRRLDPHQQGALIAVLQSFLASGPR